MDPVREPPPTDTSARYRAEVSSLRRWTRIVLVGGTVISLACAFGPLWAVRLGLISAVGAAAVSCLLAWREIGLERRAQAAAMLAASRRHGEQLREERRHNAAVVDTMSRRLQTSDTVASSRGATIARLHSELQRLQGDVNGLRGANGRLTRDLNLRNVTIRELREVVADREAELTAVRSAALEPVDERIHEPVEHADEPVDERAGEPVDEPAKQCASDAEDTGEIHAFPRRTRRDGMDSDSRERRTADFLEAQVVVSLPNYEEDRRFG